MHPVEIVLSPRLRTTPYEPRLYEHGLKSITIYNHMVLPVSFTDAEDQYRHLCEHVQVWDVAGERQVEVRGKDALALVELITPRHIAPCAIGQGVYAPLADQDGLVVNDPIVLRLAEDRFWISIADSDVKLWVKGIAYGRGMDVEVFEPDVSPLAVQGPKANDLMADLVGEHTRDIRFFRFIETTIAGAPVVLARSGWSGQGGFEIYLQDSSYGLALWDAVWEAGQKYQIRPGAPNLIERLETGLKSYGSDMTHDDHVLECGFEKFIHPDKPAEYMARESMQRFASQPRKRQLVNLMVSEPALPPLRNNWAVQTGGEAVGAATSCAYSPKYQANLLFAMVDSGSSAPGTALDVVVDGKVHTGVVKDDRWQ